MSDRERETNRALVKTHSRRPHFAATSSSSARSSLSRPLCLRPSARLGSSHLSAAAPADSRHHRTYIHFTSCFKACVLLSTAPWLSAEPGPFRPCTSTGADRRRPPRPQWTWPIHKQATTTTCSGTSIDSECVTRHRPARRCLESAAFAMGQSSSRQATDGEFAAGNETTDGRPRDQKDEGEHKRKNEPPHLEPRTTVDPPHTISCESTASQSSPPAPAPRSVPHAEALAAYLRRIIADAELAAVESPSSTQHDIQLLKHQLTRIQRRSDCELESRQRQERVEQLLREFAQPVMHTEGPTARPRKKRAKQSMRPPVAALPSSLLIEKEATPTSAVVIASTEPLHTNSTLVGSQVDTAHQHSSTADLVHHGSDATHGDVLWPRPSPPLVQQQWTDWDQQLQQQPDEKQSSSAPSSSPAACFLAESPGINTFADDASLRSVSPCGRGWPDPLTPDEVLSPVGIDAPLPSYPQWSEQHEQAVSLFSPPTTVGVSVSTSDVPPRHRSSRAADAAHISRVRFENLIRFDALGYLERSYQAGDYSADAVRQKLVWMVRGLVSTDRDQLIRRISQIDYKGCRDVLLADSDTDTRESTEKGDDDTTTDVESLMSRLCVRGPTLSPLEAAPDDIDGVARMRITVLVPSESAPSHRKRKEYDTPIVGWLPASTVVPSTRAAAAALDAHTRSYASLLCLAAQVNHSFQELTGFTQRDLVRRLDETNLSSLSQRMLRRDHVMPAMRLQFLSKRAGQTERMMSGYNRH